MVKNLGAVALSADGTIVGGVPSFSDPWNVGYLDPGDCFTFRDELFLTTQEFEQVDQYLAMATGKIVEPIEGFWDIVGIEHSYVDSYNYWNIIGAYNNNHAEAYPGVVIGWVTDADGNLLDVAYSYSPLTVIQPAGGFALDLYNWSRLYDLDYIANALSEYDFMVRTQPFIGADQDLRGDRHHS